MIAKKKLQLLDPEYPKFERHTYIYKYDYYTTIKSAY